MKTEDEQDDRKKRKSNRERVKKDRERMAAPFCFHRVLVCWCVCMRVFFLAVSNKHLKLDIHTRV